MLRLSISSLDVLIIFWLGITEVNYCMAAKSLKSSLLGFVLGGGGGGGPPPFFRGFFGGKKILKEKEKKC